MVQTPDVKETVYARAAEEARQSGSRRGAALPSKAAPSTTTVAATAMIEARRQAAALGVDLSSPAHVPFSLRSVESCGLSSLFCTLEHALRACPPGLGFNAELKYPSAAQVELHELAPLDLCEFVDAVLAVCARAAGERPLCFSTFDPDTARVARRKQARCQIYFLGHFLGIVTCASYPCSLVGQCFCSSRAERTTLLTQTQE